MFETARAARRGPLHLHTARIKEVPEGGISVPGVVDDLLAAGAAAGSLFDAVAAAGIAPAHFTSAGRIQFAVRDEVAEIIATHLLDALHATRPEDADQTALRARAVRALTRAGARAGKVGAPDVAQRAYTQAAELAPEKDRPALLEAAGDMLLKAGRLEDALALLDDAAERYTRLGLAREAALAAALTVRALTRLGRAREAADRATRALATLEPSSETDDPDVARLSWALGSACHALGAHEQAAAATERALVIAEALELPDLLADALNSKAIVYAYTGRTREAGGLFRTAVEVAQQHGLDDFAYRPQTNLASLGQIRDLGDATALAEEALATCRRRGDRFIESLVANTLAHLHLTAGRWDQLEQLCDELLEADPERSRLDFGSYPRLLLHSHRGEGESAAAALTHLAAWRDSDNQEHASAYHACVIATRLAQGDPEAALDTALRTLPDAIHALTAAADGVRDAWPLALDAALALGRPQDARTLISLLAERPRGHIPPYLRAHLTRAQALLAAAEARHDTVEYDLGDAIDAFATLAYPSWLAVTRTDLAAWLTEQERADEAAPLLDQATATLSALHARPALARATALRRPGPTISRTDRALGVRITAATRPDARAL